jgi:hypothetical protein
VVQRASCATLLSTVKIHADLAMIAA